MMICQMAGCLKICKTCKNKKACNERGVCTDIHETNKGLTCKRYMKKEKKETKQDERKN